MTHLSLSRYNDLLGSLSTSEAVSVLWMGHIYQRMYPRNDELHIATARASCHKMSLRLATSTSSLSMFSLDGKGVPQTVGSLRMQRPMTLLFLMDAIIWVMLGILTRHRFWFHIGILVTISRNGARENIGV